MAKWNPEPILKKIEENIKIKDKQANFEDSLIKALKVIGLVILGLVVLLIVIALILFIFNIILKLVTSGEYGSDYIIFSVGGALIWVIIFGLVISYIVYKTKS